MTSVVASVDRLRRRRRRLLQSLSTSVERRVVERVVVTAIAANEPGNGKEIDTLSFGFTSLRTNVRSLTSLRHLRCMSVEYKIGDLTRHIVTSLHIFHDNPPEIIKLRGS